MYNSYDDFMDDIRRSGIPRYGICDTIGLRGMLATNERAMDGPGSCFKPDPCSLWVCANPTLATDSVSPQVTNVQPEYAFGTRGIDLTDEVYDILRNLSNSIILGVI